MEQIPAEPLTGQMIVMSGEKKLDTVKVKS
jgi:hypothetical protein